jgi:DNA invertase Pin-like site-specific DNA recombinase
MEVYAYLRVSGKGQVSGDGFNRQLETIQSFCKQSDHTIDRVFQEQVSGTKDEADRPQFTEMVTAILKNGVDTIIVESLDRLAREYRIQEQFLIYLASKNIHLITANTGENVTKAITDDPMKKALVQIQGVFAELDKSLLVKKLRKARERKRASGERCEGVKPVYTDGGEGVEVLKEIRKLRRKRKGQKRMTFEKIAERLNEEGRRNAKGGLFNGASVSMIYHRR